MAIPSSSLELAFCWPQRTVRALCNIVGKSSLHQSALCSATSCSSFFSGIGSSDIAWKAIGAAVSACGLPFNLRTTFTCEKDEICQEALLAYSDGHLYEDLMDMMTSVSGLAEAASLEEKLRLVKRAAARTTARCCRCQARCDVRAADIDTSGSPCQDWSRAGLRRGAQGDRIHLLLLWMRWHRVMETPIIIHENVKGFDVSLVQSALGDMYHISHVEVGPESVGWPCCKRPRIYLALFHRRKIRLLCDPSWLFWQVTASLSTQLRVRDFLIASQDEVRQEGSCRAAGRLSWAAAAQGQCHPVTHYEQCRLRYYCDLWRQSYGTDPSAEPDLIFNLGDNPDGGWVTWSAPGSTGIHRTPTLRRKWTAQWLPSQSRWLTASERLASMAFPASPRLAMCYGLVGTFKLTRPQRHTLGNAMHLANVGVWQACGAASAILRGCSS